jgi:quinol monooxygenase YgiN
MARVASIFKLHVKEGREREFVERVNAYAEIVRRTEPGALYYEYYRLRKPRWYAVVECFADQAAEDAHMASAALPNTPRASSTVWRSRSSKSTSTRSSRPEGLARKAGGKKQV